MDGFLATNWADVLTAAGLAVTLFGLYKAFRASRDAKTASEAAEDAAQAAMSQFSRELQLVHLQRAVSVINSIKTLQSVNRWAASAELYPWLAAMLTDVISHCPVELDEISSDLSNRRSDVLTVGDSVRGREEVTKDERDRIYQTLSGIEIKLLELANEAFADPRGE